MTLRHELIKCVADEASAKTYQIGGYDVIAYSRDDAEETLALYKAGRIKIENETTNELKFE